MNSLAEMLLKRFFTGNGYYAVAHKRNGNGDSGPSIAYNPIMEVPTGRLIEQHLMGDITVGAYTLRQDNSVTWMAFDIDSKDRQKARELTHKISQSLQSIPHAIEFSGRKGYHILVFFRKGVPAENVRNIAEEIRSGVGAPISGDPHVEIFPKQDQLTESNPLGNLLKLPLGIHPLTNTRSKFVSIQGGWEEGNDLDPIVELSKTTTLEEFAACADSAVNPTELIVELMLPYWTEGQRHDLALYLSGWLATSGWEMEDAMTIVEMLQQEGGGDLDNQLDCVKDTYRKHSEGKQIVGLQALADRLPSKVLQQIANAISSQQITPIMTLIDGIRLGKGVIYLKSRSAAQAVISYLAEKGQLLVDDNTDKLYWLDRGQAQLRSMEDSWWETTLYNIFGLNTADNFGHSTAKGVYHTARESAQRAKTYSRSYWDGGRLWVNLGGAYNYLIDGSRTNPYPWSDKILNGEQGVIFRNKESGIKLDLEKAYASGVRPLNPWQYLVNDLNFGIGSNGVSPTQQRELIKAWFLSTFFPNVMPTRPLLAIVADAGAGKTTAARRFLHVLEGPLSDVNGVVADKPDSLRASLQAHKFVVLDNLEKNKASWLVDMLNRVSTGTQVELRKLHTTNETQRFTPDCFIILTATTLPFAEETLFSRILPVELAAIRKPVPEYMMQRSILDNLEGLWLGILAILGTTVRELQRVPTAPAPTESRLADFSVFCSRIRDMDIGSESGEDSILDGANLIKGLRLMTNRQLAMLQEISPFVSVLDTWLQEDRKAGEQAGRGIFGIESGLWRSASELNGVLMRVAARTHSQWLWDSGQSLSKHMQALEAHLIRNFGMQTMAATNNKPKKYRFSPEGLGEDGENNARDDSRLDGRDDKAAGSDVRTNRDDSRRVADHRNPDQSPDVGNQLDTPIDLRRKT